MRTIGRHISSAATKTDFVCNCDYCGVPYYRSKLIQDKAGYLACPKDARFRDTVTLMEGNARAAQRPLVRVSPIEGAGYVLGPINTGDEDL